MSELLIKHGMVFTYIHEGYHAIKLRMADVFIKDGVIVQVEPELSADCEVLDATGCLVLPGFINASASTIAAKLLSGLLPDRSELRNKGSIVHARVLPMLDLAEHMLDDEELAAIALLSLWEGVSGGVTTAVDLCRPRFVVAMKQAGATLNMRLLPAVMQTNSGQSILPANDELSAIYSLETSGEHLVREVAAMRGPRYAYAAYSSKEGAGSIAKLANLGFLQEDTLLVQCILADIYDRELLHAAGSSVAISAISCAQEGKGYPGLDFLKSGVNTALGTGYFGNCMISEMRAAAYFSKQGAQDAGQYQATDAFYAATVAGARTLGHTDSLGRIGEGASGDVTVVCMDRFMPLNYPLIQFLYGGVTQDVRHVVCKGKVCKREFNPPAQVSSALSTATKTAIPAIQRVWAEARRRIL